MAKQINIDLVFNANTSQARSQMNSLQNQLNQLLNTNNTNLLGQGFTQQINQAQTALVSLKTNLQSAFNVDTGRLDLSKFNQNLQTSGLTLKQYRQSFEQMGIEGKRAFSQLTNSIVQGQMPLKRTKGLLDSMMNTFGSSIKWTIAYGAIDGIRQGFQDAFQYAKDLNESLTNIGVVAQMSTEAMDKFAKKANTAAKALSTTTTEYSNAALIYYQQGLDGTAVEERVEATIKLANATSESAQTVSEWMTAIWNNFDDGSKKLEYYGDVLAKLGAETASSADEIADGFEKFAAVADTVGLSYEKGAAAIATVTATTRQSADVVGTAFKTLFARIQDLELGNTLDDGTTLGSYSEALNKVGVNIKTTSGDLKEMDTILAEMGSTWKTLSNDEQVALAKSVAGVRQYTQLIALMDNYDYFEQLTASAENAEGTLEQQQERWAESWEASSNRVKAASEKIYSNLIDDDFFIGFNNIFADLLSGLGSLMEAMGGMQTLLPLLAGLLLNTFGPTIVSSITNFAANLKGASASQQELALNSRKTALEQMQIMTNGEDTSLEIMAMNTAAKETAQIMETVEGITRSITKAEEEKLQLLIQQQQQYQDIAIQQGQNLDKLREQNALQDPDYLGKKQEFARKDVDSLKNNINISDQDKKSFMGTVNNAVGKEYKLKEFSKNTFLDENGKFSSDQAVAALRDAKLNTSGLPKKLQETYRKATETGGSITEGEWKALSEAMSKTNLVQEQVDKKADEIIEAMGLQGDAAKKLKQQLLELANAQKDQILLGKERENSIKTQAQREEELRKAEEAHEQQLKKNAAALQENITKIQAMQKVPFAQTLVQAAGGLSMVAAGLSSIVSAGEQAYDMIDNNTHSLSGWLSVITSALMSLGMLYSGLKMYNAAVTANTILETKRKQQIAEENAKLLVNWSLNHKLTEEENKKALAKALNIPLEKLEEEIAEDLNGELTEKIALKLIQMNIDKQGLANQKAIIDGNTKELVSMKALNAEQEKNLSPSFGEKVSKGFKNFGKSKSIGSALKSIVPVLIIVATFAALIGVAKAITDAYNAEADAAKSAAEGAKNLAEIYNNVKERYDSLKETLKDYSESKTAIEELTEGTKEWSEAISECNQKVLSLLETYPEILSMEGAITNVNGQLILSEEAQQELLNQQSKQLTAAYNASLEANLISKEAANESNRTNLTRKQLDTGAGSEWAGAGTGAIVGGALAYMGTAAALGSIVPVVGNIIGAIVGAGIGIYAGIKAGEDLDKNATIADDALDKLMERAEELGGVQALIADWDKEVQNLEELGVSQDLINALKDNTNAEEVQNQLLKEEQAERQRGQVELQKTQQTLTNAGFLGWNQYGDQVAKQATAHRDTLAQNILLNSGLSMEGFKGASFNSKSIVWDGTLKTGMFGTATTENKEFAEKFIEAMVANGEWTAGDVDYANYNENTHTLEFKVSGSDEKAQYSVNQVVATVEEYILSQSNYDQQLLEYTENLASNIAKLQNSRIDAAGLIGDFLSSGVIAGVSAENLRETEGKTATEVLQNILGDNYKAVLSDYGLSVEDFIKQYEKLNTKIGRQQALQEYNAIALENARNSFESQAEGLDTTTKALEMYMNNLIATNENLKNNIDLAAEITLMHFRVSNGIQKLNEAFNENIKVLREANKNSIEYYNSLAEIQLAAEEVFGFELSSDFVTRNLSKLQELAGGSSKAFTELKQAANESFIDTWDIGGSLKEELKNALEDLTKQIENSKKSLGTELTLNSQGALDAINTVLSTGRVTVAEIESMFANANIKMPQVQYMQLPIVTETTSTTYQNGEPLYTTTNKNVSLQSVPYIGDKPSVTQTEENVSYTNAKGETENIRVSSYKLTPTNSGESPDLEVESLGNSPTDANLLQKTESTSDKKKRLKDLDNEIKRYHEIDEAIENTERELDKLSKAKDRAFGKDKLALMDMEIQKNRDLLAEEQKRVKEAEKYYKQDRKQLLNNYAVKLDKEGNISNYNDVIKSITSKMKGMDSDSDAYSNMEEYLSNFKDDAAKYEESLDAVAEGQQTVKDLQYELADLAMEKIEYTVSFKVEIAEDDMAYIDFLMSKIEDDAFAVAEKVKLQSDAVGAVTKQIAATEQGISGIMAAVNKNGFMTEDQAEQLREYRDNLIDYESQLREIKTTVEESLTEAYDTWNEKLDENIDKFDHFDSVIESYRNIVDIVGKDTLGISNSVIKQMTQIQVENSRNLLKSSKEVLDARKDVLEEYKAALAAATTGEDRKYWEEQVKTAEEQVQESTESFMSNWENALTAAADAFKQNVELIVEEFEKSISGIYGSLDKLSDAFDKQKEINERYLADYEKTYEISKLNRQIEQSIDKTDNVANQKALRNLQADLLEMQEDGVKVSERDIGYMQKRYELMLAEQALRDAQNAKSVVRLQRDSEGNYGYVYTADQSAIDDAQQNYEDSLYDLQKYQEESLLTIQEGYLKAEQGFADAMLALTEANASGNADIIAEAQRNYDYWAGQMDYYYTEMQKGFDFGKLINEQYNTNLQDEFHDTITGHLFPEQKSWEEYHNNALASMKIALDDYIKALNGDTEDSYVNMIKKAFEAAGEDVKTFKDNLVEKYLPEVQRESDKTATSTKDMAEDMKVAMEKGISYVSNFQSRFSGELSTIRSNISTTITSVNNLISKFSDMTKQANAAKSAANAASNSSANGTKSNSPEVPKTTETPKARYSTGTKVHTNSDAEWYTNNGTGLAGRSTSSKNTNYKILDSVYNKAIGQYTYKVQTNSGNYAWLSEEDLSENYLDGASIPIRVATTGSGKDKKVKIKNADYVIVYNRDGKKGLATTHSVEALQDYFDGARMIGYRSYDEKGSEHDSSLRHLFMVKNTKGYIEYFTGTDLAQIMGYTSMPNSWKKLPSFDTGGYTGSWGPEGRMAMLHQKEIILNAQDTENFLAAIKIVRSMADQIEANALMNRYSLSSYAATTIKPQGDTLQQEVTIHAEFPNATNHNEIEQAFKDLNILASQYANRK